MGVRRKAARIERASGMRKSLPRESMAVTAKTPMSAATLVCGRNSGIHRKSRGRAPAAVWNWESYNRAIARLRNAGMLDRRALHQPATPSPSELRKVLLIDDDAASCRTLASALRSSGFEVTTALNGEEGLASLDANPPDVVLLDFEMPGLNGDEVCGRIRAGSDPARRELPVIMLTAHSGTADEVRCLSAGANDFVTKPVSRAVLEARIHTQLRLRALAEELRSQNDELARWRAAQETDLAAARATQQAIIPSAIPPLIGWSMQTIYRPLVQVGGDVFGWRPLSHGRTLLWLADATGHGASAALLTTLCALLFNRGCETEADPSAILRCVNREFFEVFNGRSFMTACCAVIDGEGALSFASVGHPPLLVRRADGRVESAGPHGTMLGIFADLPLQSETRMHLSTGDAGLIYSDGLFSLMGKHGEYFTVEQVRQAVVETAANEGFLRGVVGAVGRRSNGEPREDDLAALALIRC